MIFLLLIIFVVLSLFAIKMEYKDNSPFIFIWITLLLLISLPLLFLEYNIYIKIEVMIFCCLSLFFYISTLYLIKSIYRYKGVNFKIKKYPFRDSKKSDKVIYYYILLLFLIMFVSGLTVDSIMSSRFLDKMKLGNYSLIILFIVASICPYLIIALKRKKYKLTAAILFSFLVVLLFFRSRAILVLLFLPIGYYSFYWSKKGKIKILLIGVLGLILSFTIKLIRYQGTLNSGLKKDLIIEGLPDLIDNELKNGNGDLFVGHVFFDMVRDVHQGEPYWFGNFSIIKKMLYILIPYDNEKTQTIDYQLFDYYIVPGVGGSLHPTGFGVAYGDFGGWVGLVVFVFLAFFRIIVHSIILKLNDPKLIGFVMFFVLFFARGSVYNATVLLVSSILFFTLTSLFYKKKQITN